MAKAHFWDKKSDTTTDKQLKAGGAFGAEIAAPKPKSTEPKPKTTQPAPAPKHVFGVGAARATASTTSPYAYAAGNPFQQARAEAAAHKKQREVSRTQSQALRAAAERAERAGAGPREPVSPVGLPTQAQLYTPGTAGTALAAQRAGERQDLRPDNGKQAEPTAPTVPTLAYLKQLEQRRLAASATSAYRAGERQDYGRALNRGFGAAVDVNDPYAYKYGPGVPTASTRPEPQERLGPVGRIQRADKDYELGPNGMPKPAPIPDPSYW